MKPMKPETATVDTVPLPALCSPKLDGIRGRVIAAALRSNTNKPIPNPFISQLYSRADMTGFDGELVVGSPTAKDVCHVTAGTCSRTKWSPITPAVCFYVFDDFSAVGGYTQRLASLVARVAKLPADLRSRVVVLEPTLITTRDALKAYVAKQLALGYEGICTRSVNGAFKAGRSTLREGFLLRIKPREDAEALIVSVEEEMHNGNEAYTNEVGRTKRSTSKAGKTGKGRAGALNAIDLKTGVAFSMGGFTDAQKVEFWAHREAIAEAYKLGRPVVVKYSRQAYGTQGEAPRSPIYEFLVARPYWDVEELAEAA